MSLQLIQARVHLSHLYRWAGRRDIMPASFDEGYALHCLLNSSFGEGALRPFRLMYPYGASEASLYAYSEKKPQQLMDDASSFAEPDFNSVINDIQGKTMPNSFAVGRRLGFDLKVRPVRRSKKDAIGKPQERDAYLAQLNREVDSNDTSVALQSREQVYIEWLAERFEANGAALDQHHCKLVSFQRTQAVRSRQQRKGSEGPEAIMQGQVTVTDSALFQQLLIQGVGRHCAYGYGMLLLRPPKRG